MNALALWIEASSYELSMSGQVLARLADGPAALLAGAGERVRELDIEAAIERAEDWLMPSSKSFQRLALHVHDTQGRLRDRLGTQAKLTPQEIEGAFSRMFDDVAFGRPVGRALVADIVLLRELVHHGSLLHVVLQ